MARSSNIYLVMSTDEVTPIAAFTVKHELASYLDKLGWQYGHHIWRIPDGGGGHAVRLRCPQDTHNTGKYTGTSSPTDALPNKKG